MFWLWRLSSAVVSQQSTKCPVVASTAVHHFCKLWGDKQTFYLWYLWVPQQCREPLFANTKWMLAHLSAGVRHFAGGEHQITPLSQCWEALVPPIFPDVSVVHRSIHSCGNALWRGVATRLLRIKGAFSVADIHKPQASAQGLLTAGNARTSMSEVLQKSETGNMVQQKPMSEVHWCKFEKVTHSMTQKPLSRY